MWITPDKNVCLSKQVTLSIAVRYRSKKFQKDFFIHSFAERPLSLREFCCLRATVKGASSLWKPYHPLKKCERMVLFVVIRKETSKRFKKN